MTTSPEYALYMYSQLIVIKEINVIQQSTIQEDKLSGFVMRATWLLVVLVTIAPLSVLCAIIYSLISSSPELTIYLALTLNLTCNPNPLSLEYKGMEKMSHDLVFMCIGTEICEVIFILKQGY